MIIFITWNIQIFHLSERLKHFSLSCRFYGSRAAERRGVRLLCRLFRSGGHSLWVYGCQRTLQDQRREGKRAAFGHLMWALTVVFDPLHVVSLPPNTPIPSYNGSACRLVAWCWYCGEIWEVRTGGFYYIQGYFAYTLLFCIRTCVWFISL